MSGFDQNVVSSNRYITIKNDYLQLCDISSKYNYNNITKQKGGGAWSVYSSGNDSTADMLISYNIQEFDDESDEPIEHKDIKDSDNALDMMFKDYEKDMKAIVKKNKSHIKINEIIDFCDLPINDAYLGVVTWMLESNYPVRLKYLYRILAHAYISYFKVISLKGASGWFDWDERRRALIHEIRAINYAINTAKDGIAQITSSSNEPCDKIYGFVCDIFEKSPELVMDKYYIQYRKCRPRYDFIKYAAQPGVDPKLLKVGTVMDGYDGGRNGDDSLAYIVILDKSGKKVWSLFDCFEHNYSCHLDDKYIIDLYGQQYYDTIKRKMPKKLSKEDAKKILENI